MSFVSGTIAETSQEVATYIPNYDMFIKYHGGTYNNATAGNVKVFRIPVSGKHIYQVAPVSNSAIPLEVLLLAFAAISASTPVPAFAPSASNNIN